MPPEIHNISCQTSSVSQEVSIVLSRTNIAAGHTEMSIQGSVIKGNLLKIPEVRGS